MNSGISTDTDRIPSLDGLRALSVVMVLIGHAAVSVGRESYWTHLYAHYGVRVFFVISGYLITTLLERERLLTNDISIRQFYLRRAYRILPVAYAFALAMIVLHYGALSWRQIGAVATYTSAYVAAVPFYFGHLWSLSVEEQFYAVWPWLVRRRIAKGAAWGAFVLAPVARYVLANTGNGFLAVFSFPAVVDSLAAGCLLALYRPRLARLRLRLNFWAALGIMVLLPVAVRGAQAVVPAAGNGLWTAANLAVAACLMAAVRERPRVLNFRPVAWLGTLSYSLYIWQMPFFSPALRLPLYLRIVLSLLTAAASYYLIEQPILKFGRRRLANGLLQRSSKITATARPAAQLPA